MVKQADTTFLYTLNCPLTGEVRYLGKSDNPFKRFRVHLQLAGSKDTHKNHWILSLREQGLVPTMDLLDEVPASEWQQWEREYIRVFRVIGIKLTNGTEGGEGGKHSEEAMAKIRSTRKGRKPHLGKQHSTQTREKIRSALVGKVKSEEHRKKVVFAKSYRKAGKLGKSGKTWKARTRRVYRDLDDLRQYNEIFGVVGRLGFKSAESLWKANPMIGGSVRPEDFGVVHA